jgi:hypothetical protein
LRILSKLRQREDVVHDPFAVDAQCALRKKRSKGYRAQANDERGVEMATTNLHMSSGERIVRR